MHVLLAENNADDVFFARTALEGRIPAADVQVVASTSEAFTRLAHRPRGRGAARYAPDVLVIRFDWSTSADTLIERLRRHPALKDVPVLLLHDAPLTAEESETGDPKTVFVQKHPGYYQLTDAVNALVR